MKDAATQPQALTRRVPAKRTGGRPLALKAGDDVAEIRVPRALYRHIGSMGQSIGTVISGFADVAAKARRTGQTITITYKITPDGVAEAVGDAAAAPDGDRLDAALARARARGAVKAAEILRGPDMLTARDFGALIGASHETVNAKRRRHELLGLEGTTRGVRYPAWQVTDAGLPLPGLPDVFALLGGQPWAVFRFLRTAHAELGGMTALDALKAGRLDAVLQVARNQAGGAFA